MSEQRKRAGLEVEMSEQKAKAIVDTIDIIADNRAQQAVWVMLGKASNAAKCAEDARKAIILLKEILINEATL